jgi:hypothetical protein
VLRDKKVVGVFVRFRVFPTNLILLFL